MEGKEIEKELEVGEGEEGLTNLEKVEVVEDEEGKKEERQQEEDVAIVEPTFTISDYLKEKPKWLADYFFDYGIEDGMDYGLGLDLLLSAQMDNEELGEVDAIAAEVRDVAEYLYWDLHDRWSGD